jgi:hypothetical protein
MASKDSYLLEVMVEKENNVFPMIPTGASVSEKIKLILWKIKHSLLFIQKITWSIEQNIRYILKRHINIISLNVSESEIENVSKFIIVVHTTEKWVQKL